MSKTTASDAWDDDWETAADERSIKPTDPPPKLSKAQRRAQHAEQQRQLWNSAENPDRFHWLEAQGVVPLKQELNPKVTLLSRKPTIPVVARSGAADKGQQSNLENEEDSEEEARKKREADFEERQRKAKIEREEKQRRYAEARERIMGSSSPASSSSTSRENTAGRDNRKPKARSNGNRSSQPGSSADQSPARLVGNNDKQLFDPEDMGRRLSKRESAPPPNEEQPSRQPKGPETRGRGGFGFGPRGGRSDA